MFGGISDSEKSSVFFSAANGFVAYAAKIKMGKQREGIFGFPPTVWKYYAKRYENKQCKSVYRLELPASLSQKAEGKEKE